MSFLRSGKGAEAVAEFQKIVGGKGARLVWPGHVLAHLGLGRAYGLQGDKARSRKAYDDFFALWKDADADLPLLKEAKAEYAKLK